MFLVWQISGCIQKTVVLLQVWDPVLIIAQILSLQCLFYLSLGFWQALFLGKDLCGIYCYYIYRSAFQLVRDHTWFLQSQEGICNG